MITAKEALELSKQNQKKIADKDLQLVFDSITKAIAKGETSCNYYTHLRMEAKGWLLQNGYALDIRSNSNEIDILISWNKPQ